MKERLLTYSNVINDCFTPGDVQAVEGDLFNEGDISGWPQNGGHLYSKTQSIYEDVKA